MDSHDTAGTQAEREMVDILARLIDPKLRDLSDEEVPFEQKVESQFKQLPWAIEYALIKHLFEQDDCWITECQDFVDQLTAWRGLVSRFVNSLTIGDVMVYSLPLCGKVLNGCLSQRKPDRFYRN